MDCKAFDDCLELLMSDRSTLEQRRAAEAHLDGCSRCSELYGLTREELRSLDTPPPAGMVESILERTSGSACAGSRELLCDLVDDSLPAVDRQLVRLHLEGCGDCTRLHATLVHLAEDLPAFAHLETDPSFVPEVLVRTNRPMPTGWHERLLAGWRAWLVRPRAAFEMGYVGAIVLWVVLAAPISPVRGAHLKALETLKPVGAIADPESPAGKIGQGVVSVGVEVWQATARTGRESLTWLGSDLKQRYDSTGAAALDLGRRSADLGGQSIDRLWQQITGETTKENPIDGNQETEGSQQ
jgi:predicted anti-sigma-YlaC factor YlaD